ncbi:Macrolide export ATP-binding / permease protein MacB [Liberibacter crescens BT-1]|uniref:Macrolide export ATP-binding / permease protein MacB n=1 Tax=Liberibacter crescens (strain BT-1) TaxID=1215343 RepID=L0EW09_LIBCB|nr:ABC transporter ATP-binding protein [Liberibacter crescens]AGA64556.1 Macrolide export ATP-binding / permease protein MacB [Liberibacter crescens BT-1]AMC12699.1 macrolide ABC transporter ATP-binding protein [Liberibacter crescens]
MHSSSLIEFQKISKQYIQFGEIIKVLDEVDLVIHSGEFVSIMGPSGSGKSTSMNILGCLDRPSGGEYLLQGIPTSGLSSEQLTLMRRYMIGFVFQNFNLLPRTSALENVQLPLLYRHKTLAERHTLAMDALARVGLSGREYHETSQLSGGQQQRVAIARAIVTQPIMLIADEPTGNLDMTTSNEIMKLITELNRENGMTVIIVTHGDTIAACADRIIYSVNGKLVTKNKDKKHVS